MMEDRIMRAKQLRRALQIFVQEYIEDESVAREVSCLYPTWDEIRATKKQYPAKTIFQYGENAAGEVQLWTFIQDYTPTSTYTPDQDATHYKKIGITEDGYEEWSQPLGATDAYHLGDIVMYNGELWECTEADGAGNNTWPPGVYGWTKKDAG